MNGFQLFFPAEFRDHPECDGFHGIAAVASDRAHAVNGGRGHIGVKVFPQDAFDGVDGRKPVSSPAFGGQRGRYKALDVRRQFCKDRNAAAALGSRGIALNQFRNLADVRAQSVAGHVGT